MVWLLVRGFEVARIIRGVSDFDFAGAGTGFAIDKILTPVVIVTFAFGSDAEGEGGEGEGEGDHIVGDIERAFIFGVEGEDIVLVVVEVAVIGERFEEGRGIGVEGLKFMLDGGAGGFRDKSRGIITENIKGVAGEIGHKAPDFRLRSSGGIGKGFEHCFGKAGDRFLTGDPLAW